MPIRKELRHFYGKKWRTVTRPRILERAKDKCETCRAPNLTWVVRHPKAFPGWWFDYTTGAAYDETGTKQGSIRESQIPADCRYVRIVLTVAHLNHIAGEDQDDNLKALCQRCHLKHDHEHHRDTRAGRKDRERPLLAAIEGTECQS